MSSEVIISVDTIDSDFSNFIPPEVGPEIWIGTIVSFIPILWATYEFSSRVKVQRECLLCKGSGLVYSTRSGGKLTRPRKCWSCGGFIPWYVCSSIAVETWYITL